MSKKLFIVGILGIAVLFVFAGIYAKTVPDVIELKDPAYEEHEKGIVQFKHKLHQDDYAEKYPEFYKNGCGECHHDKDGKPLSDLKEGDDVQRCIECHKKVGEAPRDLKKEWRKKKLPRDERKKLEREYQAEAYHDNCTGCHRKWNREYKPEKEKKAPTTCNDCHP